MHSINFCNYRNGLFCGAAGFLTIQIIQTILGNTWQYIVYCHNTSFLIIIYIVRKFVLWQYVLYCQVLQSMVCIVCMDRKPVEREILSLNLMLRATEKSLLAAFLWPQGLKHFSTQALTYGHAYDLFPTHRSIKYSLFVHSLDYVS